SSSPRVQRLFFSSRRRHTRSKRDWSSDVCSSDLTTDSMSGGEKAKYKLANVISNYSPILLLDEPTNHLDKIGKDYLNNILKYYYGTLIIVSHDRALIDKIANTI